MDKDEELRNRPLQRKKQLAEIIDLLIREDPAISNPALDFAESSFQGVTICVQKAKTVQHKKHKTKGALSAKPK